MKQVMNGHISEILILNISKLIQYILYYEIIRDLIIIK